MICANPRCGKEFTPRTSIQRCCSDRCGRRVRWARGDAKRKHDPKRKDFMRAYYLAHPEMWAKPRTWVPSERSCPTCRAAFTQAHPAQVYCSAVCSETSQSKRAWARLRDRVCSGDPVAVAQYERRKAQAREYQRKYGTDRYKRIRAAGVEVEKVDTLAVFERDGWRCQLCGIATPPEKRGTNDDDAPELDHRIPIKLGGPHTYANVQCACRRCNRAKGARLLTATSAPDAIPQTAPPAAETRGWSGSSE